MGASLSLSLFLYSLSAEAAKYFFYLCRLLSESINRFLLFQFVSLSG